MKNQIEAEINKIKRKYVDSAAEIVRSYNQENSLSRDYEGRQIYELLQNADDASSGIDGKVQISFDGRTLSVSNTGAPFSFAGVKSLLYSYTSPKQIQKNKIGCKGLGFRSILSWAKQVTIASKDFCIQFSKEYAREFYSTIINEHPDLIEEIRELTEDAYPIAILTCPKILDENQLADGFSTSIILECIDGIGNLIERQITSLEFEELIFLPNLNEIEIKCNNYHKSFYKIVEKNEVIIETKNLLTGKDDCARWLLFRKTGCVLSNDGKEKNYEFTVAYDPERKHTGEVLYSYFKTDIKMHYPALIHGTFELTSDRNNLQKGSLINSKLMDILSDFLVQTAIDISQKTKECNYDPLRMVISANLDHLLVSTYSLDKKLKEKAKGKKILPTISGKYVSILENPFYSDFGFDKVLYSKDFENLMPVTDDRDIKSYIKNELKIGFMNYRDFCAALNDSIDSYSLQKKVDLICLIDKQFEHEIRDDIFPHLLEDINNTIIANNDQVYLLPSENQLIDLPKWSEIRFFSNEMENMLINALGIKSRRLLKDKLARYHLDEYSFDRLIRGVVVQTDSSVDKVNRCNDVIKWLWKYYDNTETPLPIDDIKIKVVCRDGVVRNAKECYLGKEFFNELGDRLVSVFSDSFISPSIFDSEIKDSKHVQRFLEWLGASKYPRMIKKALSGKERDDYLKHCNKLFVQSDGCEYSYKDFTTINTVVVGCFEQFDLLLTKSNFNDLLAWFMTDEIINSRLNVTTEEKNPDSRITGLPGKKQNIREVKPSSMKSYLLWRLSESEWIPGKDGIKKRPRYCSFYDDELSPIITVPDINYSHLKKILGRNCKKEADAILNKLGVVDVFQELDKHIIYEVFFNLCKIDTGCKIGKGLYRKILKFGLPVEEYTNDNKTHDDFVKNGTVLVKSENVKKYVPVSDAFYADKKIFSNDILKSFNMLDVDRRSGEDKIQKLFGVKPLKCSHIDVAEEPTIHFLNEKFQVEYIQFLPFVYACRIEMKNAKKDCRILKSTKIVLCSQLQISYNFSVHTKSTYLGKYETVYFKDKNIAYIQVPIDIESIETLKKDFDFANSIAELICDLLDVQEDKALYRDLFSDSMPGREKRMRYDRNDDALELLTEARKQFDSEIDPKDEFWKVLAEVVKLKISDSTDTSSVIRTLGIDESLASSICYENLSEIENCPHIISLFEQLKIDISEFNSLAVNTIDLCDYWKQKIKEVKAQYRGKYHAYLYFKLKEKHNNSEEFDRLCDEYDQAVIDVINSINVDVESLFKLKFGADYSELEKYDDVFIEKMISEAIDSFDKNEIKKLKYRYSESRINAYALFNRLPELQHFSKELTDHGSGSTQEYDVSNEIDEILSSGTDGFCMATTQALRPDTYSLSGAPYKKQKAIHSESTDITKQKIGLIGEAIVYKELKRQYSSTTWVSGNAEKAGVIQEGRGNDTLGYDMYYTDEDGTIQYIEVKSSHDDSIAFHISDSELKFAMNHAKSYEIIFVKLGDNKLKGKPIRLGHLFEFSSGENLYNNNRFAIESKNYLITASAVEIKELSQNNMVMA